VGAMDELGSYLRRVRKELNLTLRAVEEKTGISNAYLSQLENNKIFCPSPKVLHKLAECYKVSYEYLMKLAGYPTSKKESMPAFKVGGLDDLTPEERERVLEFIQFLKSRRR
jgi:transcriptional regulator with XRE-family HTH domain